MIKKIRGKKREIDMQHTLSAKRIIVSSLAIFFVDHVADYVALNSESESRRVCDIGIGVTKM